MVEIELDMDGNSHIYLNEEWVKIYPGDNGDFELTKAGKKLIITTWHGFKVSQAVNTVDIRVPGYYHGRTYGLCGDNDKDAKNDYMTSDWEVLPYPPQGGYKRWWQEAVSAESWITGSAELRGCLPYEEKPELITPELAIGNPGPGPNVTFACSDEVKEKCNELIEADWLQACVDTIDTEAMIGACQVE